MSKKTSESINPVTEEVKDVNQNIENNSVNDEKENLLDNAKDFANKVVKGVKSAVYNVPKEKIQKNLEEAKVTAIKVSQQTTKKIKKIKEVSEDIRDSAVKTSKIITDKVDEQVSNVKEKEIKLNKKMFIEFGDKQISENEVIDRLLKIWTEERSIIEIKDLKIYYKVEESIAYCLVNNEITIGIKL